MLTDCLADPAVGAAFTTVVQTFAGGCVVAKTVLQAVSDCAGAVGCRPACLSTCANDSFPNYLGDGAGVGLVALNETLQRLALSFALQASAVDAYGHVLECSFDSCNELCTKATALPSAWPTALPSQAPSLTSTAAPTPPTTNGPTAAPAWSRHVFLFSDPAVSLRGDELANRSVADTACAGYYLGARLQCASVVALLGIYDSALSMTQMGAHNVPITQSVVGPALQPVADSFAALFAGAPLSTSLFQAGVFASAADEFWTGYDANGSLVLDGA